MASVAIRNFGAGGRASVDRAWRGIGRRSERVTQ